MKALITILSLGLIIAGHSPVAFAKAAKKTPAKVKKAPKYQGELKTDIKFSDHDLHGQYQTPDEALSKVENEKNLSDLLGARKHFKDRLQEAADQE